MNDDFDFNLYAMPSTCYVVITSRRDRGGLLSMVLTLNRSLQLIVWSADNNLGFNCQLCVVWL